MSGLKRVVRFHSWSATVSNALLVPIVLAMLVATGCSSGRRKSRPATITITTTTLPEGVVGVAYPATQLDATGGTGPYTWSNVNNTLQTYGLTLDPTTGEITGTPAQATPTGGVTVTIQVTDANNKTAQKDFTLVIYPELQITTTSLPDGYEGQTGYSVALTATGGTGTYTWSLTSGTLPANLSWDATTATISGDIAAGTADDYPLQFQVTDGVQTITTNLTLTVHAQLQITTTSLDDATEEVVYSYTVQAPGGDRSNYNWSVSGHPSWLSIDATTGELSGTPPAGSTGTYTFTVEVTDGQQTAGKQFDLVVNTPPPPKADFEASPTYGKAPLTVTFADKSAGNPTSWEWDFDGDGTPDLSYDSSNIPATIQHTYSSAGWYSVTLTVTGAAGSGTCVKKMYILVVTNNIYYVDGVNGDDANGGTGWGDAFATIGKALSVAGDHDLVLVADATYNETDLNFSGKKIYLKGVDHNSAGAQPVIDCQGKGRAFYFGSGETKDSVIDNFTIQNGRVEDTGGGAMLCDNNSFPTITNCVFRNNEAVDTDGTNYAENGGAICCKDSSSPSIANCTFSGNSANWYGGAIYCCNSSGLTISGCTFSGNGAWFYGGAIYCDNSSPTITNCAFYGNSTNKCSGGAICCVYSMDLTLTNCTFSGNSANWYGGAIWCYYNSTLGIANCTFSGNSAGRFGGAVYCCSYSILILSNCILWSNTANGSSSEIYIADSGSLCILNYCCVDNTGYGGQTGNITENNCIYDDPQFVDPDGADNIVGTPDDDLHPQGASPCIDAGDNSYVPAGVTTDFDGNPRIAHGRVDIGAYECQMWITTTALPDAVEGLAYSYTVRATGGNPANYNWSISGQPSWLSIDAATGELSGTPPSGSAGNTFTFIVTVDDGQRTAGKRFVLVVKRVAADFEASPTQGKAPLTVNFTDKSGGNITQWQWDFDNDGTPDSTQRNPTHTYNNPGCYTVKLTVTGPAGSDSKEMYIQVANNLSLIHI